MREAAAAILIEAPLDQPQVMQERVCSDVRVRRRFLASVVQRELADSPDVLERRAEPPLDVHELQRVRLDSIASQLCFRERHRFAIAFERLDELSTHGDETGALGKLPPNDFHAPQVTLDDAHLVPYERL